MQYDPLNSNIKLDNYYLELLDGKLFHSFISSDNVEELYKKALSARQRYGLNVGMLIKNRGCKLNERENNYYHKLLIQQKKTYNNKWRGK